MSAFPIKSISGVEDSLADFVFDPLDAEFLENPYPVLRALRQDHPAHWHEGMRSWIF